MSLFRGVNDTQQALAGVSVDTMRQTLELDNVDNTSDLDKPLSTAAQSALAGKQDTLVSGTSLKTINGESLLGSGNLSIAGGGGGDPSNLAAIQTPTTVEVSSSSGSDAIIVAATDTNAGIFLPAEKVKLSGIAAGATANSSDAVLLNRANHTGTQEISTVTGLQTALNDKQAVINGWFMPVRDTGNDSAAIQAAINAAAANGHGTVWLGSYTWTCATTLTLDPQAVDLRGVGAILDFSSMTAGNCVVADALYSAIKDDKNTVHRWEGFTIKGNSALVGIYFTSSNTTGDPRSQALLNNVNIISCKTGVYIHQNAYLIVFNQCRLVNSTSNIRRDNFLNNGENISFYGCTLGAASVSVRWGAAGGVKNGELRFFGCSFDFNKRVCYTESLIEFHGCHFESNDGVSAGLNQFEGDGQGLLRFYGGEIGIVSSSANAAPYLFTGYPNGGLDVEIFGCGISSTQYSVSQGNTTALQNNLTSYRCNITNLISGKQNTLVSGTNIKTVNHISLLGTGNIDISGGSSTGLFSNKFGYSTGASFDGVWGSVHTFTGLSGQLYLPTISFTAGEIKTITVRNSEILPTDVVGCTPSTDLALGTIGDFTFTCGTDTNNAGFTLFVKNTSGTTKTFPAGSISYATIKAYYDLWVSFNTYGTDAHLYLAGVGVVQGKNANNFSDTAGTTASVVGGTVARVNDVFGTLNMAQGTAANQMVLQTDGTNYYWECNGTTNSRRLSCGAVGLAESDNYFVIAGFQGSSAGVVFDMVNASGWTLGRLYFTGTGIQAVLSSTTRTLTLTKTGLLPNTNYVVALRVDSGTVTLWVNGVQEATASLGTVGAQAGHLGLIGARESYGSPLSGQIHAVSWVKGTVSDLTLVQLMRAVNAVTGATTF